MVRPIGLKCETKEFMSVKSDSIIRAKAVDKAVKTEIKWLISRQDGAPNFELRKFKIAPGGRILKHYHPHIEHEQYVLKGSYMVGIGDEIHHVKAGDALYIPAGVPHWYNNDGRDDAEFLCIVPKKENYQAIYLEEEAIVQQKNPKSNC